MNISSARALSSAITPIYPAFELAQYFIKAKMDMKQMFHMVWKVSFFLMFNI